MFAAIAEFFQNIVEAIKRVRAESAAKDAAASKPMVDHVDAAADDVATEIKRAGGTVGPN